MRYAPRALLAASLVLGACKSADEEASEEPDTGVQPKVDLDDPRTCKGCHEAVFEEWSQSMHAQAHHVRDPLYAAVRKLRLKKEGEGLAKACANCHSPRSVDAPESPIAQLGVTCTSCHAVQAVDPKARGAKAMTWTEDDVLLGPHDPRGADPVVHLRSSSPPQMKDGYSLCMACHGEVKGQHGVPVCSTGPEWSTVESRKRTCVECHMPWVKRPSGAVSLRGEHRSHRFFGPRSSWRDPPLEVVAAGLSVSGKLVEDDLRLTLVNQSQHALPTGFPGRILVLRAVGYDAEDKQIWQSKPLLFNKVYKDAEGKPTLAPYATELAQDTRLKPDEMRKVTFTASQGVTRAEVRVGMRLLPPPLAEKLGITTDPLADIRPVMKVDVKR